MYPERDSNSNKNISHVKANKANSLTSRLLTRTITHELDSSSDDSDASLVCKASFIFRVLTKHAICILLESRPTVQYWEIAHLLPVRLNYAPV